MLKKSSYQAFIFDMDGTIVSTAEDICDAVNYSLKKHSLPLIELNESISYLGNGSVKLIQRAMHYKHQELFQSVFDTYYNYYLKNYLNKSKPYDGILEALDYSKKKGIMLFVYTNKPEKIAQEIVDNLFPKDTFSKMIGIPLGGKTKPNVEAFINAGKEFNLDYSKIAYFGDSTTDVKTANNLGVKTMCSVLWGYQSQEEITSIGERIDFYLKTPQEIEKIADM